MRLLEAILSVLLSIAAMSILAQEPESPGSDRKDAPAGNKGDKENKDSLSDTLTGFGFALGIGVSHVNQADILDASLENHLVRVNDEENTKTGVWLDINYNLDSGLGCGTGHGWFCGKYIKPGFWMGVQLANTTGSTLNSVGFGIQLSMRRHPLVFTSEVTSHVKTQKEKDDAAKDKSAFNIGIGWATTKIQRLGNGIVQDQPLPSGEEQVRYKKLRADGPVLMFTFTVF